MFKFKKLLAIALTFMLLIHASHSFAIDRIKTFFYSDATYTVVVGRHIQTCRGGSVTIGQITPYFNIVSIEPCEDY